MSYTQCEEWGRITFNGKNEEQQLRKWRIGEGYILNGKNEEKDQYQLERLRRSNTKSEECGRINIDRDEWGGAILRVKNEEKHHWQWRMMKDQYWMRRMRRSNTKSEEWWRIKLKGKNENEEDQHWTWRMRKDQYWMGEWGEATLTVKNEEGSTLNGEKTGEPTLTVKNEECSILNGKNEEE